MVVELETRGEVEGARLYVPFQSSSFGGWEEGREGECILISVQLCAQ
jgi:hypothetical protein